MSKYLTQSCVGKSNKFSPSEKNFNSPKLNRLSSENIFKKNQNVSQAICNMLAELSKHLAVKKSCLLTFTKY